MKTAIIGAMDEEIRLLREALSDPESRTIAQMTFLSGKIGENEVVVVKSGVGKVNAAVCVQILKDHFQVTRILNTGVAGSLCADINIGDFVVSTDAVHHDVNATLFGYAKGEVPQLGTTFFAADEKLSDALCASVKAASDVAVHKGRVASGDQFIADAALKQSIRDDFDALCCEMEGAAIAQASFLNGLPFCIIRAISDKADGSDIVDYPVFEKKAAADSAAVVMHFLKGGF